MKTLPLVFIGFLAFSFCLLLFSSFSKADDGYVLKYAYLHFPPICVFNPDGEPVHGGTQVEDMQKVMDRLGYKYEMHNYAPARLYHELALGQVDFFIGLKGVEEYDDAVIYSDDNIYEIELRVYALKGKEIPKTREQLKGKHIITILGFNYGGLRTFLEDPANNIMVDDTPTHEQAFKKLMGGRADYLLEYSDPSVRAMKKLGITDVDYQVLDRMILYMMVSKKTPNAEKVLSDLVTGYGALQKERMSSETEAHLPD